MLDEVIYTPKLLTYNAELVRVQILTGTLLNNHTRTQTEPAEDFFLPFATKPSDSRCCCDFLLWRWRSVCICGKTVSTADAVLTLRGIKYLTFPQQMNYNQQKVISKISNVIHVILQKYNELFGSYVERSRVRLSWQAQRKTFIKTST